jgi:Ca2+-binding RTX toxin-like protein
MLQMNRTTIMDDEKNYGVNPDGSISSGKNNIIGQDNNDSRWKSYPQVQTVAQAFAPAEQAIVQALSSQYTLLAGLSVSNYLATDIYLNPGRASGETLSASYNFTADTHAYSGNVILIGSEGGDTLTPDQGNDNLVAGSGADVLIAGAGRDTLQAGSGSDTLIAGAGNALLAGAPEPIFSIWSLVAIPAPSRRSSSEMTAVQAASMSTARS